MVPQDLRNLVKFDADQLREAILKLEQEAADLTKQREEILAMAGLYRQILRTHGFEEGVASASSIVSAKAELTAKAEVIPAVSHDRRFRDMKIADAVVMVLSESGGGLHGQKIIDLLAAGGLKVGGEYPMSTLVSAMRRDRRIEKDPKEKNTWRLRNVA